MKIPIKKLAIISLAVVITGANAVFLGLSWRQSRTTMAKQSVVPTTAIKSGKSKSIDTSQQGVQLQAGSYKYETLKASKVNDPQQLGKLALASHEGTGSHFVLALENSVTLADKVTKDWTIQQLATDTMWAPGGCSSKPTYLLQGKYIFIDDGKTHPSDKYNSYVIYNLQTNEYIYFGGDNFSEQQTAGERILASVNENDQLVFYIDPTDKTGALHNNTTFKHAVGSDQQYVIRRVIDPATLTYKDYKLPFTVPQNVTYYYMERNYGDSLVRLTPDGSVDYFAGKVVNNRLELSKPDKSSVATYVPGSDETDLERSLNGTLISALSELAKAEPFSGSPYSTKFSLTELGSTETVKFLVAHARYGNQKETPLIYNTISKDVVPLVAGEFLEASGGGNYVPLGVF